jgi:phosphate transport system substrate-binding protein
LPALLATAPQANEVVVAGGAALLADLQAGVLDGIFLHALPPETNLWTTPVALDGLVLLVGPSVGVDNLSLPQAQALLSGRLGSWQAVGGADRPVVLYARERDSQTAALQQQWVLREARLAITAQVLTTPAGLQAAVATDPAGLGVSLLGALTPGARTLAVDGVAPTTTSVADQTYPLTAPLYFVAPAEPVGDVRAIVAWLQSAPGQALLGETYGRVR